MRIDLGVWKGDNYEQAHIRSLKKQVDRLSQQGRYKEATGNAMQISKLVRKSLGRQHPDYAESLSEAARLRPRIKLIRELH